MEHQRRRHNHSLVMGGGVAVLGNPADSPMVDFRGTTGHRMFVDENAKALGSGAWGGAMLRSLGIRSRDDWPIAYIADPCLSSCKGLQVQNEERTAMMTERRPATTIGELDIHLGFIMEELRGLRAQQQEMLQMLATKREVDDAIARLDKRIDEESATMFFNKMKNVAIWVTVIAAAAGVIVAFARAA
jgi:hypothetical protein